MAEQPAFNPYRAPAAEIDPPSPTTGVPLASRAQRFWGAAFDGVLHFICHATIYLGVSHAHVKSMGGRPRRPEGPPCVPWSR